MKIVHENDDAMIHWPCSKQLSGHIVNKNFKRMSAPLHDSGYIGIKSTQELQSFEDNYIQVSDQNKS